jgi:competence protein ComEC
MTGPAIGRGTDNRRLTIGVLPMAALGWLGGTMALHQMPALPGTIGMFCLVLALIVAACLPGWRWLGFCVGGFLWAALAAELRLNDRLPSELVGADLRVSGWVDSFPDRAPDRIRFSLRVTERETAGVPRRLRLTWYDTNRELSTGDALELIVRLRRPRGLANPGGFDYERWLLIEDFGATGYVRSGEVVSDAVSGWRRAWFGLRAKLAQRIGASVANEDAAALLTALALGERSGFTDRHWSDLRRTGTSHLVAISGMHVGMIAALLFGLMRWLWIRLPGRAANYDLEVAAACAVVAAFCYAALAGFAVPTQRALVMIVVALGVVVSRVAVGPFNGLAVAVLAVLIRDPLSPLSASFWMSFFAVMLLLMMADARTLHASAGTRWARTSGAIGALARLQWNITLGLVPLMALNFGELSLVSPLVNFVAIPFFTFVLVPGTLLLALALAVFPLIGTALAVPATLCAEATWWLLGSIAAWPVSAVMLAPVVPWAIVAGFAAVLLATPAHPLPGRRLGWLVLAMLFVPAPGARPAEHELRVVVFDVGHGLAVLVETRGHSLLYDAGPRYASGFDSGADIVLPGMAAIGSAALAKLVVSHDHNDHTGGAEAVLSAFPAAAVQKGPDIDHLPGEFCEAGQQWRWDGVDFEMLHPAPGFAARGNDSSCVLKVSAAGGAVLITGDIEARAERLLSSHPGIAADVVIVAHHGSATSSTQVFVDAVHARHAVVSVDYYSRWNFPRPEVRRRWQAAGADVHVTGEAGALTLTIKRDGIDIRGERGRRMRYWHADGWPIPGESALSAL